MEWDQMILTDIEVTNFMDAKSVKINNIDKKIMLVHGTYRDLFLDIFKFLEIVLKGDLKQAEFYFNGFSRLFYDYSKPITIKLVCLDNSKKPYSKYVFNLKIGYCLEKGVFIFKDIITDSTNKIDNINIYHMSMFQLLQTFLSYNLNPNGIFILRLVDKDLDLNSLPYIFSLFQETKFLNNLGNTIIMSSYFYQKAEEMYPKDMICNITKFIKKDKMSEYEKDY